MNSPSSLPTDHTAHDAVTAVPETVAVLGVDLALTDYETTLDWMDATIAAGERGYIAVAATPTVMATQGDPELAAAVGAPARSLPGG